ncbi:MAG: hypothetical protein ACK4OJ_11995 [Brevundimonas sp.]
MTAAIKPEVVRYAVWFLDAAWPLKTVASLFDVTPKDLLNALDPEGATT